jgi:ElaB/YqjD/DUF883 family membrane-anchored ribosome-binding protein
MVSVAFAAAACGGGGGGGGEGGDIVEQATQVEQLISDLEALPTTATTQQEFSQQLSQLRSQVQQAIQDVTEADAPDEVASAKEKLSSRLRGLRTQLGRIQGLVDSGDLEAAQNGLPSLLAIVEIKDAIEQIREASGGTG